MYVLVNKDNEFWINREFFAEFFPNQYWSKELIYARKYPRKQSAETKSRKLNWHATVITLEEAEKLEVS